MNRRRFSGWGGIKQSEQSQVFAPGSVAELGNTLAGLEAGSILGRGLGRSYGDSALNSAGLLVDCRFLDRFLAFDHEQGILQCEAGVSILQINQLLAPAGWMLPVTPGTQYVTIAGAIANDVHGKNHWRQGSFACHVQSLQLLRSNGELLTCTASSHAELFAATLGGLGLTGLIVKATIRLRPIRTLAMQVNSIPFDSIETLFQLVREHQDSWEYQIAWLDPSAGCQSGSYILADHQDQDGDLEWPRQRTLAFETLARLPTGLAGRWLMQAGNLWYRRLMASGRKTASALSVLYPLDRLPGWNVLFGKPGFYQHQCLLPEATAREAMPKLLKALAVAGQAPTLAVAKWFGHRCSQGLLSFPAPGISLALDFANRGPSSLQLLDQLDQVVATFGGRIYVAKDQHMSAEIFAASYPKLEQFANHVDPRFGSDFWRRMGQQR